jgi:hypothetical protein
MILYDLRTLCVNINAEKLGSHGNVSDLFKGGRFELGLDTDSPV